MRIYNEQPQSLRQLTNSDIAAINKMIRCRLEDALPECATNEWFIGSIYFAGMVDDIVEDIVEEFDL